MRFGLLLVVLVLAGCTGSKEAGDLPASAYVPQQPQNQGVDTAASMIRPLT